MRDRKILFPSIVLVVILIFLFLYIRDSNVNSGAEPQNSLSEIEKPDIDFIENNKQTYDSFLDFPYNNMIFVNQEVFHIIRQAYGEIEFFSEFNKGDLNTYDLYKEKYNELLNNEVSFIQKDTSSELYLYEFKYLKVENDRNSKSIKDYIFYFFDIDEDNMPELCISDGISFIYVFKYITELDKVILWYEMDSTWYQLNGSRTIRWNYGGLSHGFYKLNSEGEEIYYTFFFIREDFNRDTEKVEVVYMISLPYYVNDIESIELTEDMINQGYFDEGQDVYYFRVTEEQFEELTKEYFEAEKLAKENLKEVSFSYEELFGDN